MLQFSAIWEFFLLVLVISAHSCRGSETVSCYDCNSVTNRECQRPESVGFKHEINNDIKKCTYQKLPGMQGKCYTAVGQNIVVRSCEPIKVNDGNKEMLYTCAGNLCNNQIVADRKCIECDENDGNCAKESELESFSADCKAYTTTCFRCENSMGNQTVRGCGSRSSENLLCTACSDTDACYPAKPPRVCYTCNSEKNPLCSQLDLDYALLQKCKKPDDYCIARLTEHGYTVRGCMSEIENADCSEKDPNCIKCNHHYCNVGIIPSNRIKCHQCGASNDHCNEKQVDQTEKCCGRYIPDDKCYTYMGADNKIARGCESDENINSLYCNLYGDVKCKKCDSSGCNNLPYQAMSGLKCSICTADNEYCAWSFNGYGICKTKPENLKEESCFIYKHENGSVSRGCTLDSELCSNKDDPNCITYKGDFSNNKTTIIQSCYICASNKMGEENCADNPGKIKPMACPNEYTRFTERGCYTRVQDGHTTRGCVADIDQIFLGICEMGNACKTCYPDDCNKSSSKEASVLAIMGILFYWLVSNMR